MREQNQQLASSYSLSKATIAAMSLFSLGFILTQPNTDAFNVEEAINYILDQKEIDYLSVHIAGFAASLLSNLPLLFTILYHWKKAKIQHHENQAHHHSWRHELLEFITIGVPFTLLGSAAYLDTLKVLHNRYNVDDSLYNKIIGGTITGLVNGFGAYKLHSYHLHHDEDVDEISAISQSKYYIINVLRRYHRTFFVNIVNTFKEEGIFLGLIDIWRIYGIVMTHMLGGYYAGITFSDETLITQNIPLLRYILCGSLPLAAVLFEANTEARSIGIYRHAQKNYSNVSRTFSIAAGVFHSLPAITALSLILALLSGNEGVVYNSIAYGVSALICLYPSVMGFMATTIPGFDEALKATVDKIKESYHFYSARLIRTEHRDYGTNEIPSERVASKSKSTCCPRFFRSRNDEEQQGLILDEKANNSYAETEKRNATKTSRCTIS